MTDTLRLTMLTGPHKGDFYCVRGTAPCVVGRTEDCAVQLAGASLDQLTSRHHCQLCMDPSCVRLQDLGSKNGTFLNGRRVEADANQVPLAGNGHLPSPTVEIDHGDVLMVGATSIRVEIITCPRQLAKSACGDRCLANGQVVRKDCPAHCCGRD